MSYSWFSIYFYAIIWTVNYRAPEMAIYLRTCLHASFHPSGVTALYARIPCSPAGPPWKKVVLASNERQLKTRGDVCSKMASDNLRASKFQKVTGGACPQTPPNFACLWRYACILACRHPYNPPSENPGYGPHNFIQVNVYRYKMRNTNSVVIRS